MADPVQHDNTVPVTTADPADVALSVGEAAARVGLTAATLRTWDRRYGLAPSIRTPGGHRRYSGADLQRLRVAARLVAAGHPAAEAVAASALPQVGTGTEPARRSRAGGGRVLPLPDGTGEQRGIARAAMALDGDAISGSLSRMIRAHGVVQTWDEVIAPVLVSVGDRWARTGEGVEVEHVLAHGVAAALAATTPHAVPGGRPVLLACMPDEEHVLPLLALHSALLAAGTPSVLLGHKVPSNAVAEAVKRVRPRKVVLWAQVPQRADIGITDVLPAIRPLPETVLLGPGWADSPAADDSRPRCLADAVSVLANVG